MTKPRIGVVEKPRRKAKRKSLRTHCDTLYSLAVRARDQVCQASGLWGVHCGGRLEAAHFIPRRVMVTRYELTNAAALCSNHHAWLDGHPLLKADWIRDRLGAEGYDQLQRRQLERWDRDYLGTRERLKAELAELGR